YRKLSQEQAASGEFGPTKGLRIAKMPEVTPVIKTMRQMIMDGAAYAAVAGGLNDEESAPGPYATKAKRTGRLVENLLRDPILHGTRTFGDVTSQAAFRDGKRTRKRNPKGPETENYPELAHLSAEEHASLLAVMDARAEHSRHIHGAQ